jgi:hypothetical protein
MGFPRFSAGISLYFFQLDSRVKVFTFLLVLRLVIPRFDTF